MHMCDGCGSILVDIMKNIALLSQLGKDLTPTDLQTIAVPHDDAGSTPCPKCAKPMERFDYMDAGEVTLDRCSADRLLFMDVEEVTDASILLLRTRSKLDARRAEDAQHLSHINELGDRARRRLRKNLRGHFRRNM